MLDIFSCILGKHWGSLIFIYTSTTRLVSKRLDASACRNLVLSLCIIPIMRVSTNWTVIILFWTVSKWPSRLRWYMLDLQPQNNHSQLNPSPFLDHYSWEMNYISPRTRWVYVCFCSQYYVVLILYFSISIRWKQRTQGACMAGIGKSQQFHSIVIVHIWEVTWVIRMITWCRNLVR